MARLTHVEFSVNPDIISGTLCFAGTRIPVATVVGLVRKGWSAAEVAADYPGLTPEIVEAAVETSAWGDECAGGC